MILIKIQFKASDVFHAKANIKMNMLILIIYKLLNFPRCILTYLTSMIYNNFPGNRVHIIV